MSSASIMDVQKSVSPARLAISGAIAGLVGGIVFGVLMGMMNALPMVGMLVGQESALIGFIVHLGISAFIGAIYGFVIGHFPNNATSALVGGIVNGVFWWVLGALVLMPLLLGMSEMVFAVGQMQWMSLVGHILYGLVTAFVFIPLADRL